MILHDFTTKTYQRYFPFQAKKSFPPSTFQITQVPSMPVEVEVQVGSFEKGKSCHPSFPGCFSGDLFLALLKGLLGLFSIFSRLLKQVLVSFKVIWVLS